VAMKLFGDRAIDYMRSAGPDDRRYLLFNPITKMKVTTEAERVIDLLWDVIAANLDNPARKLLYGNPGTMVVAAALHERTGEPRWAELWRRGAERLLASWRLDEELGVELWTQELGGSGPQRYVGAAHGLAGNARSLLRGGLLAPAERDEVERRAVAALTSLAALEDGRANWPPLADRPLAGADGRIRTQWCHGSPGVVTSLALAAPDDEAWTSLLVAAGRLVLDAGAIRDNAGLCHGTTGNGHAMLALWRRTGDELWLACARRFATHAAAQLEATVAREGGGRHSLFTGDLGVALYLRACLDGDARIPTLDWL